MTRCLLLSNQRARLALGLLATFALFSCAWSQPSYTVSARQLQQAVTERFPRSYPLGGVLELNVQAPQLRLLPELNRLGADVRLVAAGPALQRSYGGRFDLDFSLRYEASDLSIRAHQLRLNSLSLDCDGTVGPGACPPGQATLLLDLYGPALAAQVLQEVVLHRLSPQDLATPNAMGLQPGNITVTAKGLHIAFVAKPAR